MDKVHPQWPVVPLNRFLTKVRREIDVQPRELYSQIGIRSWGKGIFHKEPMTGEEIGDKHIFWVEPGDFVLNIVFAWEGAVALVSKKEKGMCASHRFPTFIPNPTLCDAQYLLRYFQTPIGVEQLGLCSPGGAGRNRTLNQSEFLSLSIPLPPLAEQRKIAAIVGTWDAAIATVEQLIAALQARKQGLMQRLLTGAVRFPEFATSTEVAQTKFGPIPSDWEIVSLESTGLVNARNAENDPDKEWYYIDISSVEHGNIDMPSTKIPYSELPSRAQRVLRRGDIIMATVRPNLLGYAKCDFDPVDVLCSTGFALISPKNLDDSEFLYQSLYSKSIQGQIESLVTGSNYPAINSSDVKSLQLHWPTRTEERIKIGEVLRILDLSKTGLERYRSRLSAQKQALMQQLLTGQVRVKVADDEKISQVASSQG